MRVTDMVIKFITVRIDEKQKKIDKRKKARDKRAARRPAPQVAAPAAAGARSGRHARGTCVPAAPGAARPRASCTGCAGREPAAAGGSRRRDEGVTIMAETKRRKTHQRFATSHRRRQGDCGQETIFPAQESVPVLRRQDRRYQLQGRAAAQLLHQRARQDHAAADLGRVRAASAAAGGSDQAGAQYRADAVLDADLTEAIHGSHSQRRHRQAGKARPGGEGHAGLRAQFSAAQEAGRGGHRIEQKDRRAGTAGAPSQRSQAIGRMRRIWAR